MVSKTQNVSFFAATAHIETRRASITA